jgi:hypothetical protein
VNSFPRARILGSKSVRTACACSEYAKSAHIACFVFVVGLPGFEPGSREPKSHSLDQASRQPHATRENKLQGSLLIPIEISGESTRRLGIMLYLVGGQS